MDWTRSMQQTFIFFSVNPDTWKNEKIIDTIKSASIDIDMSNDTIYSANIVSTESLGEQYVRIYLVVTQDGKTERIPLGTFLVQNPSSSFNGKVREFSVDAYSPLIELKEKKPPIGYSVLKPVNDYNVTHTVLHHEEFDWKLYPYHHEYDIVKVINDETKANGTTYYQLLWHPMDSEHPNPSGYTYWKLLTDSSIMSLAYRLCSENMRAPVILTESSQRLSSNFVSDISEDWLSFLSSFIANANYRFHLDALGNVGFEPIQNIDSLQPRFTYSDDELSILQPDISIDKDLYGIPNVVEVIYSTSSNGYMYSRVVNDSEESIVSTVNRGREILYRETNPDLPGKPSQEQLDDYAKRLLKKLSKIEGTISYKHGFCPVRVGDCVYINYKKAGIKDLRAVVKSQSIECKTGCQVSETAIFTEDLWG